MKKSPKILLSILTILLTLPFAFPVAAFQSVDVNEECGSGATEGEDCGQEGGVDTTEGTCQSIGTGGILVCTASEDIGTATSSGENPANVNDAILPRFSIPIPTISLGEIRRYTKEESKVTDSGTISVSTTYTEIPWLADYISGAYRYAVFVGSILAAVMIMIGGVQWMTAAGSADRVGAAKKRISNATIGLILIIGTHTLLMTIDPQLTTLNPLKITRVDPDEFIYTGGPDDSAYSSTGEGGYSIASGGGSSSGGSSGSSGGSSSGGSSHRDSMFSVCEDSGDINTLKQVLPVWVSAGRQGAAVYVRGGRTRTRDCSSNARVTWLRSELTRRNVTFPADGDRSTLKGIYDREVVSKIFAAGRACGDCVSWTQQLFKCAGHPWINIIDMKTPESQYLVGTGDTCREAAANAQGGLQFGDAFYSNNVGHMFTYTGGQNLGYEIIEMGGRVNCRSAVPGVGGNGIACISTHTSKDNYFTWIDRPRTSSTATTGGRRGRGNCMVFRYFQ
jgi:hypothetical protein